MIERYPFTAGILILVLLAVILWSVPAKCDTVAQISVCPKEYQSCSPKYADSHYSIPVESKVSTSCFMAAMMELAKMHLLDPEHDTIIVVCVEK